MFFIFSTFIKIRIYRDHTNINYMGFLTTFFLFFVFIFYYRTLKCCSSPLCLLTMSPFRLRFVLIVWYNSDVSGHLRCFQFIHNKRNWFLCFTWILQSWNFLFFGSVLVAPDCHRQDLRQRGNSTIPMLVWFHFIPTNLCEHFCR